MKQKFYFIVVLSALIAICLPLTGCHHTAVAVDEQAAEPTTEQAVDKPVAKPAAAEKAEEAAAKPAAAKPVAAKPIAAKPVAAEKAEEAAAKPAVDFEITRAAICRQVVEREPVDAGTSFESPVERLYCFTHITGAQDPIEIHHVWYFADTERAVVTLKINSVSWRTYSSKVIQPHEIGDWRVDVLGPEGNTLKSVNFKITP